MNLTKTVLISLLSISFSGCSIYRTAGHTKNYYYLNPDKNLYSIGRVALVELENTSSYPQVTTDVTESLFQAMQKKQVFGLTVIPQSDPAWRRIHADLDSTYTLEQLSAMHKILKCDAILIGTITKYGPYPHLAIGLRLKLIDLEDGQLLWALEQIWDSSDKNIEYRMKDYFKSQMRLSVIDLRKKLMAVSSLEFIKFVGYETAETLP